MDDQAIADVVHEIAPQLIGRFPGKVFQLGPHKFAIDFRLPDHNYLFISIEPAQPQLYLIKRRARDLEKQSIALNSFTALLKKELSQQNLVSIKKETGERVVYFNFMRRDDAGPAPERTLVAQLTGRSANLFLLNIDSTIIGHARYGRGIGQTLDERYQPPPSQRLQNAPPAQGLTVQQGPSISEQLDVHYRTLAVEQAFKLKAKAARAELGKKIGRARRLLSQLKSDLATHDNADQQKHIGDLLLANVSSAKRSGNRAKLIDYFAEGEPEIEIEIDDSATLAEEASRRFALYSRSKRAAKHIASRIEEAKREIAELNSKKERLENIIAEHDELALKDFATDNLPQSTSDETAIRTRRKQDQKIPGTRRYLSSDGFEILVGRAARDNDNLTFKVARPNDLWLHAADYPGSHVVVRSVGRKEIPQRTIIEAAQLAAHFSQAIDDSKVDVHYTQRKFLSKIKGAAPGLVRMSRFKNMTVRPKEELRRF